MIGKTAAALAAALVIGIGGAARTQELPPRDQFLRDAREALSRSQELWHRYAYKERRTELRLNPFGRMGTGATLIFDVRPSANSKLVHRRLVERDGVALSAEELNRQDAEYRARIARLDRDGDAQSDEQRRAEDLLARRRAQMLVDDVVKTLQFEMVRREFRNGRPVIVVSFAPRPDARPVTREGRVAKVFRGFFWIDEATRELIDVRATAAHDVSFGGFVAKIYEGTEAVVQREEIEPGVWMPTRLTLRGDVRALFRKAHIDHVVEWFDYQLMK
jgi:hypothetical protein